MVASTLEGKAAEALAGKVPGERDWEAYRRVVVEREPTRQVAKELGISQTRVCQVVEHVVQFLAAELPDAADKLAEGRRIAVAKQIAASRMEHLYDELFQAWKTSQREEVLIRRTSLEDGTPKIVESARRDQGNVRYIAAATRVLQQLAKLPSPWLTTGVTAGAEQEKSPEPVESLEPAESPESQCPPVRDCSPEMDSVPPAEESAVEPHSASHSLGNRLRRVDRSRSGANRGERRRFSPCSASASSPLQDQPCRLARRPAAQPTATPRPPEVARQALPHVILRQLAEEPAGGIRIAVRS